MLNLNGAKIVVKPKCDPTEPLLRLTREINIK